MLKKQQDSTRISRRDVVLATTPLAKFLYGMVSNGVVLMDIAMHLELYAEANGTIVAECHASVEKGLNFCIFRPEDWKISDDASDLTRQFLESIRPKNQAPGVFDIFTGKRLKKTAQ